MPGVRSTERTMPAWVWPYSAAITFSLTVMFRNSRSVWKVRAMPLRVILFGGKPDDRLALEEDVALLGRVDAGHEVEERRLAGAVGPDHADDLVLVDVQVEVGDHLQPAERLRDALQLEQRRRHQPISTFAVPNRPCGLIVITAIRSAPKST